MPLSMQAKPIVEEIKENLRKRITDFYKSMNSPLRMALIIFTNEENPASKIYVKNKIKFGEEIGVKVCTLTYKTKQDILNCLQSISGPFIIQEPALISQEEIQEVLNQYSERDMDCFSSHAFGDMAFKRSNKLPCTPAGIVKLLEYYYIMDQIKTVTILGRSKIVGSPLEIILRDYYNKTVTVCHRKTPRNIVKTSMENSDLIVSAIGDCGVFDDIIPSDKVLVDVGINKDFYFPNKITGDFTEGNYNKSRAYTPVPGGVGPMTVAMLMSNTVKFYEEKLEKSND